MDTIVAGANGTLPVAFDAADIETVSDLNTDTSYTPMLANASGGDSGSTCLQLKGNAALVGAPAEERTCSKSWGYGYWTATDAGFTVPWGDPGIGLPRDLKVYTLRDRTANLCLEVAGRSTSDGAKVQLGQCVDGDNNQAWTIPPPPDPIKGGTWQPIENVLSGKCLTPGPRNANGTSPIVLESCFSYSTKPWQYWKSFTENVPLQ